MHLINMKNILLPFLIVLCCLVCTAQTQGSIALYGYKQAVLPGNIPSGEISEDGIEAKAIYEPKYNFFIYTASNFRIYPMEIWIKGNAYSAKTEIILTTPVVYINPTSLPADKKITLVPKTSKKVIKLSTAPAIEDKSMAKAKSLSKTNELVIIYKQGGKFYYVAAKKMVELEPVAMQ